VATFGTPLWGTTTPGSTAPLPGPDTIGLVPVPSPAYDIPSVVFPIKTQFPWSYTIEPQVTVHTFGDVDAMVEQRFYTGDGLTHYVVNLARLNSLDLRNLVQFFRSLGGPLQAFWYDAPNDDGGGTTRRRVRFDNAAWSWQQLTDFTANTTITLVQVPDPNDMPWYDVAETDNRFPSSALQTSLLGQTQQLIPLVSIQTKEAGYPKIYVSDRRCTIGGQLYLPRLIDFDGISQELGPSDDARFRFGNADRVMTQLANSTDLKRATLGFSLFHVDSRIKLDLWRGEIKDFSSDEGPTFEALCSDRVAELTLQIPQRLIDRACWKQYNDGKACPAALVGATNLSTPCDKGFDTPNGCQFHSMDNYFGGIIGSPQGVNIRDNGESGRPNITATSIVSDTIYGQPLPHIYTDIEFPVNCLVIEGRDESDFYSALGIVGEGPIGSFGANANQLLDGLPNHAPYAPGVSLGNDPNFDHFALDESSGWSNPYKAAGTAFLRIRRTDTKGLQPSLTSDHSMTATVSSGLSGYMWSGPGARTKGTLTSPVWIAVNEYLRAIGLWYEDAVTQESAFDVSAAVDSAAICNLVVPSLVYRRDELAGQAPITGATYGYGNYSPGSSTETQFKFIGMLAQQKPLKDWLDEILLNCLGYFTTDNGKLQIGIRENASAVEAFTIGNMVFGSLTLKPFQPDYNDLTAVFADQQFSFQQNTLRTYDIDNARLIGDTFPRFEKGQVNLSGTASASQAARVVITRLREELGGVGAVEWRDARLVSFKTTVLALNTAPGKVISVSHPDVPGAYIKLRITSWKLNPDYSIDVSGRTVTTSMYDLTFGPKPADVGVPALPVPHTDFPYLPAWAPQAVTYASGDQIGTPGNGSFSVATTFQTQIDNSQILRITATGLAPVTSPFTLSRPIIRSATYGTTGAFLPGATEFYAAVVGVDASGRWSARSNVLRISVPAGTNTNAVFLSEITYPQGSVSYVAFLSNDPNSLRAVVISTAGTLDSAIGLGVLPGASVGIPPDVPNVRVRLKAKPAINLGVARGAIASVVSGAVILQSGVILTNGQYVGRTISLVGHGANGAVGINDFVITASSVSGNSLSLTPDPSSILASGDLFVIRTKLDAWSSTSLTDNTWSNPGRIGGLGINQDVGKMIRIIGGTGRGQLRVCTSNTATTHVVGQAFDPAPDATSIYTVEDTSYLWQVDTPVINNGNPASTISLQLSIRDFASSDIVIIGVLASDGLESDETTAPYREVSILTPLANVQTGINLLTNSDFEVAPATSGDANAAGWYVGQNDANAWSYSRETSVTYSGAASIKASLNAGLVFGPGQELGGQFFSRQRFGVKPGESYSISVYAYKALRSGQPASFIVDAWAFLYVFYADGSADGIFGTLVDPAANGYQKISGRVTIPTNRGTPLYMLVAVMAHAKNSTGSNYTTQAPYEADIYFDNVTLQKVVDANSLISGSVLPSQGFNVNVVQNSNSSGSCTIGLSWDAQSVPLSNRDTFQAQASGSPRVWIELDAGRTYSFYLYGQAIDGTVHFGSGDPPSTPPSAPNSTAALACYYDGRYPLGVVTVTTPSVSGGTGSGSGTSSTICPEGSNLVEVLDKGIIQAIDAQLDDVIRGVNIRTGETIWRRIVARATERSSTWRVVNGCKVSPSHDVWVDAKWQQPWRLGPLNTTPGTRVQLSMDASTYDDQNFVLVHEDGSVALIMHNAPISS
jgi:hypothetical protein